MSTLRRLFPVLLVLCGGCVAVNPGSAASVTHDELRSGDGWVYLDDVPFVAQETGEDCGAAALSMVLGHWGVGATAAEIQAECRVPGASGLRAIDLRDAARRRGLSAYLIAGELADIERELRAGRPVLVGLVKTFATIRVAHFEVVVGLRPQEQVAALDPSRGLVRDSLAAFSAEWAASQQATLVVFRPEPKSPTATVSGP